MIDTPHILAETDFGVKLVIGLIAAAIWGISALANLLNKQKKVQDDEQRREQIKRAIEAQRASAAAAARYQQQQQQRAQVAPRAPLRAAPAPPARYQAAPPAVRTAARAPVRTPAPPPLPLRQEPVPAPLEPMAPVVESASRPKPLSAGATAIAAWMKPGTLRQQFILTEVLQEPVALRDSKW
jgi:hypothetical protein